MIYTSDNDAFTDSSGALNQPVSTAPLTITASNASRTYGAVDPVSPVSGSGFAPGETVANLGGAGLCDQRAGGQRPVGGYTITPWGLTRRITRSLSAGHPDRDQGPADAHLV